MFLLLAPAAIGAEAKAQSMMWRSRLLAASRLIGLGAIRADEPKLGLAYYSSQLSGPPRAGPLRRGTRETGGYVSAKLLPHGRLLPRPRTLWPWAPWAPALARRASAASTTARSAASTRRWRLRCHS